MRTAVFVTALMLWSFGLVEQRDEQLDADSLARLRATQSVMDMLALPPAKQTAGVREFLAKLARERSADCRGCQPLGARCAHQRSRPIRAGWMEHDGTVHSC